MNPENWIALITNIGTLLSIIATLIIGAATFRKTNSEAIIGEKKIAIEAETSNVENTKRLIEIAMQMTQDLRNELKELRDKCDGKMAEMAHIQTLNERLIDVYFQTIRAIGESIEAKEKEMQNGTTSEEASRLADVTLLKRLKELQAIMVNMIKDPKGAIQ